MTKVFWKNWVQGNEIERLKMVSDLPVCNPPKVTATLVNSYFEDLYEFILTEVN